MTTVLTNEITEPELLSATKGHKRHSSSEVRSKRQPRPDTREVSEAVAAEVRHKSDKKKIRKEKEKKGN